MPTNIRPQPTILAARHQRVLREQPIDNTSPSSILHDFSVLLEIFQPDGLQASGTSQLLPIKILSQLNSQLNRPIQHGLTRPQQKSFPHINSLYLLLRASGLARAERHGAKHFLVLDQTALDSWHGLNLTEQYCTLLETWLLRWNGEIIGERHIPFHQPLMQWNRFFQRIPAKGLKIAGNKSFTLTNHPLIPSTSLS